jgi:hypothetical protein
MRTSELDDLKARVDLRQLAECYTVLQPWACRGREAAGPCPHPGCTAQEDGFHVHADGWFKCYSCHPKRGDAIEFVLWMGLAPDFKSACAWLQSHAGSVVPMSSSRKSAGVPRPYRNAYDWQTARWQEEAQSVLKAAIRCLDMPLGKAGRDYLDKRGILPNTWRAWKIGFDPARYDTAQGRQRPALVRPWYWGQKLCALKYRFVDSQGKNDRFTQKTGGKQRLFGLQMRGGHGDTVILCEGELNAISIWQALHMDGVAIVDVVSFGAEGGDRSEWVAELCRRYRRVVFWIDKPEEVRAAMANVPGSYGLCSPNGPSLPGRADEPSKLDANEMLQAGILGEFLQLALAAFGGGPVSAVRPGAVPAEISSEPEGSALREEISSEVVRIGLEDIPTYLEANSLKVVGGDPDLKGQPWRPRLLLASGEAVACQTLTGSAACRVG